MIIIRTQDRTQILECNNIVLMQFSSKKIPETIEYTLIQDNTNETYYKLGHYSTMERVLEVINEIEKHIDLYTYVYDMPKE